jgi:hypothetical protein
MLRAVLAAFAALAMSACSYGSAVDIAPFSERLDKPAAAPGDYCEVKGHTAPFTVVSHEDCVPVIWDQATRTYTMIDPDKKEDSIQAAVVSLGSGAYAAQIEVKDDEHDAPDRYQLHILLSKGNAFTMLSALEDEPLKKLAKRHRQLGFKEDSTGRPYIAEGSPGRIKAFLRDAAKESLRTMKKEDDDFSIGILDRDGAPDHEASKAQTQDIEAILKLAKSMTPR